MFAAVEEMFHLKTKINGKLFNRDILRDLQNKMFSGVQLIKPLDYSESG